MRVGLDYAWSKPSISAIRAAGYGFVCRYLSWDSTGKNLTRAEATALRAAGVDVVSNWEYWADDAKGHRRDGAYTDPRAVGAANAREALRQHNAAGGPPGAPIYFSVDWDATDHDKAGCITDYFRGVASVLPLARVGAYGGYWVIRYLFDHRLITYGWQTYAWSGGHWDGRAQLRQVKNGITVGGHDCDRNEAHAEDFGQWDTEREDDVSAEDVWNWDGIPAPADSKSYASNKKWSGANSLAEAVRAARSAEKLARALTATLDPAKLAGALAADLKAAGVGQAVSDEQLDASLRRVLGSLDQS